MKSYLLFFLILFSSASFSSLQGKGKLSMTGEIIESACSIATNDVWQEIDFGDISIKDIISGKRPEKEFIIHLVNCSLEKDKGGHWNSATVTFDGPAVDAKSGLFTFSGQGQGMSLQIIDSAGAVALPGVAIPPVSLTEGSTNINFRLSLVNNGSQVLAGDLSSTLRFMVSYQ